MYGDDTKNKLQDIISGTHIDWQADYCTAARNFLCTSFSPSITVKRDFERFSAIKKEQAESLTKFIGRTNRWLESISQENRFLTVGGEAEVYFFQEEGYVSKVNDAVYYSTWLDFFTSVLIHNLLFEDTSYELKGFIQSDLSLKAVLKQKFIPSDAPVDIVEVKNFLEFNGFSNTRRNDYFNKELCLILEDIHDENVIMNSGNIFFIDTVFYIDKSNE
jgi:hypothetical protein